MSNLRDLKLYVYRLYLTFLKPHIKANTLLPSPEEEDSVKAFCVLSHAAFEEYFETISKETINNSYRKYKSKIFISTIPTEQQTVDEINLVISQLIKSLILSSCYSIYSKNKSDALNEHKSKLERVNEIYKNGNTLSLSDVSELTKKTSSYTKEILKETVKFFENYIAENNGASLRYLLKLLIPAGIDIPESLVLNSLQKLAEYRGTYAHKQGDFTQVMSASDIVKYAIDVLKLCTLIDNDLKLFTEYIKPTIPNQPALGTV